jgi:hypothetical protein
LNVAIGDKKSNKNLDPDGLIRLAAGIIKRAKEDYIRGKYKQRKEVEKFIRSDYYRSITNMDNGEIALAYWEEKRRAVLGEGRLSFPNMKIFLVEGLITQRISYDKLRRHQIIVMAKDGVEVNRKVTNYGIIQNNKDYKITELKGVNEQCRKRLQESNGLLLVKDESV